MESAMAVAPVEAICTFPLLVAPHEWRGGRLVYLNLSLLTQPHVPLGVAVEQSHRFLGREDALRDSSSALYRRGERGCHGLRLRFGRRLGLLDGALVFPWGG